MAITMHKNKSVDIHRFAMVPRADIPRSSFRVQSTHKTTLSAGPLIPIYCAEVLPGDTFNTKMTAFARMATPIYPLMDNLWLDSFFFFVPNRLVWTDWVKFMGEQTNPGDSISYTIPQCVSPVGGYPIGSIFDYFGLPTVGQVLGGATVGHSALPLRAYTLIWNQWFRDENLVNSQVLSTGDGPDPNTNFSLLNRGKRHDYFTSCLPWPQKGATAVTLPLGTSAPVQLSSTFNTSRQLFKLSTNAVNPSQTSLQSDASGNVFAGPSTSATWLDPNGSLIANLSSATAATINQLRQSFQIQKLLERDARGGTRYTEIIRSHFGVISPDMRLQRPEYLGGGTTPVSVSPIAQTSGTGAQGTTTPVGTLTGYGTVLAHGHGFSQSFTEHGYIIGLVSIRADLTYQQGYHKMWSRLTRYDFFFPVFSMLGEQAVLNAEIYSDGSANDPLVFGYQERWAEYRYKPSMVTCQFRSTSATPLDAWHLAEKFAGLPALNSTFITLSSTSPPMSRVLAQGVSNPLATFIFDSFFDEKIVRCMPTYSVPGLIDHF